MSRIQSTTLYHNLTFSGVYSVLRQSRIYVIVTTAQLHRHMRHSLDKYFRQCFSNHYTTLFPTDNTTPSEHIIGPIS